MKKLLAFLAGEPVATFGVLQAAVGLLLAFGVDISDPQKAAVYGVYTALSALWVRSKVSPA